jgi:hypothetical protein
MEKSDSPLRILIQGMINQDEQLYALVDAARDFHLALGPRHQGVKTYTLLEGEMAPFLDSVAPHLVPINLESDYLELWAERLGGSAGILLLTKKGLLMLREHLRNIFTVTDEENNEFFFRYYDPRVLRAYLPTCTGEEAKEFFGPIRRILAESDGVGRLLVCETAKDGVNIDEILVYPSALVASLNEENP